MLTEKCHSCMGRTSANSFPDSAPHVALGSKLARVRDDALGLFGINLSGIESRTPQAHQVHQLISIPGVLMIALLVWRHILMVSPKKWQVFMYLAASLLEMP